MEEARVASLGVMKRENRKIVGMVVWDAQMARLAELAEADFVSVGDTVGVHLWGRDSPLDISLDEMVLVCRAVRSGTQKTLVSCDFPFGPVQEGKAASVRAAIRLVQEAGAHMIKLDGVGSKPGIVEAISSIDIPVIAQFGLTPQTAIRLGIPYQAQAGAEFEVPEGLSTDLVTQARRLEAAGAVMLDFTNSGPILGHAVVEAVGIPVVGGFGGGPWLDGRIRLVHDAIGYSAEAITDQRPRYANVASDVVRALRSFADDVRQNRQVLGR